LCPGFAKISGDCKAERKLNNQGLPEKQYGYQNDICMCLIHFNGI